METYMGTIVAWAPNFAPKNWMFCYGQLLPISQWTALFALLGTIYGGDGRATFALPDLRGRAAIGAGQGLGLPDYPLGAQVGTETVTLTANELPTLGVSVNVAIPSVDGSNANTPKPTNTVSLGKEPGANMYSTATPDSTLKPFAATGSVPGGNQPFNNRSPELALNYIICTQGLFPPRN